MLQLQLFFRFLLFDQLLKKLDLPIFLNWWSFKFFNVALLLFIFLFQQSYFIIICFGYWFNCLIKYFSNFHFIFCDFFFVFFLCLLKFLFILWFKFEFQIFNFLWPHILQSLFKVRFHLYQTFVHITLTFWVFFFWAEQNF